MESTQEVRDKVNQIVQELKTQQLWQSNLPVWVTRFGQCPITTQDFALWLQFIYLPNLMQYQASATQERPSLLVPQAVKHFAQDIKRGRLLKLLVELDSLM